jgi:pterin-4a-carbinolamine dehydratase
LALVKAWPSGLTDKGWGLLPPKGERDGFMPRYNRGEFNPKRVLHGYAKGLWAFAFIMRSMRLVAIDIDGKNGGLEHAKELGMLPLTLAETSKSGDGYHLFYLVDEQWDETTGFARLSDRIGIVQGVDIRATGCVYHHPQQRWNSRALAPLPEHLYDQLTHRDQKIAAQTERINKVLENNDPMEVLMMQDEILSDLAKPIPAGKRNNTLFAIGSQMQEADIENWEVLLKDRASQVGLADDEADKIVANVQRYAGVSP